MNWKMNAKTILIQLHHKVQTFESINKRIALAMQNNFMEYMQREFKFEHLNAPRLGNSMHFHVYKLQDEKGILEIKLNSRYSTDADGIAESLGLQADQKVELDQIIKLIEQKITNDTLFSPI